MTRADYAVEESAVVSAYVNFIRGGDRLHIDALAKALLELHGALSGVAGLRDEAYQAYPLKRRNWTHHEIYECARFVVGRLGLNAQVEVQLKMHRDAEARSRVRRATAPFSPTPPHPPDALPLASTGELMRPTPAQQAPIDKFVETSAVARSGPAQTPQVLPLAVRGSPIVSPSEDSAVAASDGAEDGARARAISGTPDEQPLEAELLPLATEMRALLSDATRTDRDVRYEIGVRVHMTMIDARYGDGVVTRLAHAVGQSPRALQEAASVARRWSRPDYEQLGARMTARGEPITWRHLTTLASVADDAQRTRLVEEVFERGLSTRQLEEAIRPKRAAKSTNVVRALVKRAKSDVAAYREKTPGIGSAGTPEERAELRAALGQLAEAALLKQGELSLSAALGERDSSSRPSQ